MLSTGQMGWKLASFIISSPGLRFVRTGRIRVGNSSLHIIVNGKKTILPTSEHITSDNYSAFGHLSFPRMVWGGETKRWGQGRGRVSQGDVTQRGQQLCKGSAVQGQSQGGSPTRILLEEGDLQKRRMENNKNFSPWPIFVFLRGY